VCHLTRTSLLLLLLLLMLLPCTPLPPAQMVRGPAAGGRSEDRRTGFPAPQRQRGGTGGVGFEGRALHDPEAVRYTTGPRQRCVAPLLCVRRECRYRCRDETVKLFVAHIPSFNETQVRAIFEPFGPVAEVRPARVSNAHPLHSPSTPARARRLLGGRWTLRLRACE
jgi:hypothetical protein